MIDVAAPSLRVSNISSNSRDVESEGLFLACAGGRHHGLDFLGQALAAGARAVAWEPQAGLNADVIPEGVTSFSVPQLGARLGELGDVFYGQPSAGLDVTGVTGTNGKTTVAFIVNQALNQLGRTSGYSGTLGYGVGEQLSPTTLTTPGSIAMHRRLREMLDAGAQNVIAEVSSHALDQGRIDGVRFKVAALTNLSQDHLDYHGTMERYAAAKARLFIGSNIDTAVVNIGDGFGAGLAGRLKDGIDVISVALVDTSASAPNARLVGRLSAVDARGIGLKLHGDFGEALLTSPLWGRFNGENLVVAVGILLALNISLDDSVGALTECFAPPGRMQRVEQPGGPSVVVDFAHTTDGLAQALTAIREHAGAGSVWCVFGCGGDRDAGKRGLMGAVAAELADHVVITDDNPRHENSADIIDAIVDGMPRDVSAEIQPDRAAAIRFAIESAAPNDIVLIAGKGHESTQIYGDEVRRFSDVAVAREQLESRP